MGRHMNMPGVLRARKVWLIIAAAIVLLGLAFVLPGSPARSAVRLAKNMDCYRQPESGGIAAIGDSITAGNGLPGWGMLPKESWLSQSICASDLPFTFNGGIATQTTQQIEARLDDVLSHDPSVVVVLAGTNDVFQGDFSPEAVSRLKEMLTKISAHGAVPVIGTLPPMDAKAQEVIKFNDLIRQLSQTEHVRLIDFYPTLAEGDHYRPDLTRDGGMHPSVAGAEAMGKVALPVLEDAYQHRTG